MSQAEELLRGLSETPVYSVTEAEYVTIDSERYLSVPDNLKKLGVSTDHGVNTVHFVGPRYSENGTDLSTMSIWINYLRSDDYPDQSRCENVHVDEEDETVLHYDWVITRNVTEIHGNLTVLVCAKSVDESGIEKNHWNTEMCNDFYVSEGFEVQDSVVSQYPDLIEYMLLRVATVEDKTTKDYILNCVKEYLEADPSVIIDEIEKVIAEQPIQDYVNEYMDAHANFCVTDSRTLEGSYAGAYEMVSMEGVSEQKTLEGKNLVNGTLTTTTQNGVTVTNNGDGTYTVNGTATANTPFVIKTNVNSNFEQGREYKIIGTPSTGSETAYFLRDNYSGIFRETGTGKVITYDGTSRIDLAILVMSGVTCNNVLFKPMITTDLSATYNDFEPYCGGKASPNPDYPQEVESVGPEITITTTNEDGSLESTAHITLPEPLRTGDILFKEDNVWKVERNVIEEVYDGDEAWGVAEASEYQTRRFYIEIRNPDIAKDSLLYCSNFNVGLMDYVKRNDMSMYAQPKYICATDTNSRWATVDDFKSYLANSPMTVLRKANTPTYEVLNETSQEALDNLLVYNGITHVIVEGTEVQPIVTSRYGTSECGASVITQANKIEKLEELIGNINAVLDVVLGGE